MVREEEEVKEVVIVKDENERKFVNNFVENKISEQ